MNIANGQWVMFYVFLFLTLFILDLFQGKDYGIKLCISNIAPVLFKTEIRVGKHRTL